jgi:glycopeptide antibiotics resistance protein
VDEFLEVMEPLLPLIPLGVIAVGMAIVVLGSYRARRSDERRDAFATAALDVLSAASLLSILVITLLPHSETGREVILTPFHKGFRSTSGNAEMIANVVLFVPLGAFAPARWRALDGWGQVFLGAAGLSLAIEVLQYVLNFGRESSTTDVILNTAGALLGYVVLRLVRSIPARASRPDTA